MSVFKLSFCAPIPPSSTPVTGDRFQSCKSCLFVFLGARPGGCGGQAAQIFGHLLAQDLAQAALGQRLVGFEKVLAERLIHHRLIPGSRFFRARPKFIENGVINENGYARLPLLLDDRASLAFRKVVFRPHIDSVPFVFPEVCRRLRWIVLEPHAVMIYILYAYIKAWRFSLRDEG